MARLLSVNVGLPRDVTWNAKTVRTSVWKSPVSGRRLARRLNIDGDAQADLAGHGGEHRAVFVYQMDSYHYWERFWVATILLSGSSDRLFTTLSRWRGPLPGTRLYAVHSQMRCHSGSLREPWPRLMRLVHDHGAGRPGSANISSPTDSSEESNHAF